MSAPSSPALKGYDLAVQLSAKTHAWHSEAIASNATAKQVFIGQVGARVVNILNFPAGVIDAINYFALSAITLCSANSLLGPVFDAAAKKLGSKVTHDQLNALDALALFRQSLEFAISSVALPILGFIAPGSTTSVLQALKLVPEATQGISKEVFEETRKKLATAENTAQNLKARLEKVEGNLQKIKVEGNLQKITEVEEAKVKLVNDLTAVKSDFGNLKQIVEIKNKELEDLKTTNALLKQMNRSLTEKLEKTIEENSKSDETYAKYEEEAGLYQQLKASIKQEKEKYTKQLAEQEQNSAKLLKEHDEALSKLHTLENEKSDLTAQLESLHKEHETHKETHKTLQAEHKILLSSRVAQLAAELENKPNETF